MATGRRITLRDEEQDTGHRSLWAHVDDAGDLHIDGQDLGRGTELVSSDGEYEWFETIAAADIPALVDLLGGQAGAGILDLLADCYSGPASYSFERTLSDSGIQVERFVYSG